jgi:predicted DNA-binding transcriptional regulator AlpA
MVALYSSMSRLETIQFCWIALMPNQTALPTRLPPRLITREAAAAYICVSPNTFDEMVNDGRMPRPKMIGKKRLAWDIQALDAAVDRLPLQGDDAAVDTTWGDVDAT